MEIRNCDYRLPTARQDIYVCRHSKVEKPDNLVTRNDCLNCKFWSVKDLSPREIKQIPKVEKVELSPEEKEEKRLWNISEGLTNFKYTKDKTVTLPQFKRRLDICDSCPERAENANSCTKCGCNLIVKASLLDFTCPIDKWPKLSIKKKTKSIEIN